MAFLDETAGGFVAPGPPGASAYEVWRGQGNTGTLDDFFAAQKGEKGDASTVPGPPGIQGPPGTGTVLTRTATTDIPASTWVVEAGNGTCSIADPANMTHRGKVLGLVATAALAGGTVTIASIGPVTGISGAFGTNDPLYIGDGLNGRRLGSVVGTPPASRAAAPVWRQQVGTASVSGLCVILLGLSYEVPASSALPIVILPPGSVRRSQLLSAVSATLAGGVKGLLASGVVSPDPDDSSNVAYYHEPFATPSGALAGLISTYLQRPTSSGGLGLSPSQASAQMAALFAAAALQLVGT